MNRLNNKKNSPPLNLWQKLSFFMGLCFALLLICIFTVYVVRVPLVNWALYKATQGTDFSVVINDDIDISLLTSRIYFHGLSANYRPLGISLEINRLGFADLSFNSLSELHITELQVKTASLAYAAENTELTLQHILLQNVTLVNSETLSFECTNVSVGAFKAEVVGLPSLVWQNLSLKGLTGTVTPTVKVKQFSWTGLAIESESQEQQLSISKISLQNLDLNESMAISIARFDIDTPKIVLSTNKQGQWTALLPAQQKRLKALTEKFSQAFAGTTTQSEPEPDMDKPLNLSLGKFNLNNLSTTLKTLPPLSLSLLQIDKLSITETEKIDIDAITLKTLHYGTKESPIIEDLNLQIQQLKMPHSMALNISSIDLELKNLYLHRQPQGTWNFYPSLASNTASNTDSNTKTTLSPAAEATTIDESTTPESTPTFEWSLQQFSLTPGAVLSLTDEQPTTNFHETMTVTNFTVSELHNQNTSINTQIKLEALLGKHSKLSAQGSLKLAALPDTFNSTLRLKDYELSSATGYAEQATGYAIQTGQINIKSEINASEGKLKGQVKIDAYKTTLEAANEETIDKLNKNLTMPLPIVLSVLEDRKEHIKLSIPIKGDVNSPDFSISEISKLLMTKALQEATKHYISQTLFPQLGLLRIASTVGGFVYDNLTELPPLTFETTKHELTNDHKQFINNVGKMLEDKKKLKVYICGIAVVTDAKDKENRLAIAVKRAETIREFIIKEYQVDPTRLLQCRPTVDKDSKIGPRANIRF